METMGKYSSGQVVVAVLSGTMLGALTALLLAPKSGRDTRQQLAGYFHDARHTLARVPEALKVGSHAARQALAEPKAGPSAEA